jgi:DNA-binding NarL/FixJ family response regulator
MIRIVLVDDHPTLRAGLEAALEDEPGLHCVGSVGSDHELWPVLAEQRPDVVLLDHHLPGGDGLHVCRRLKAAAPAPRVLILSANASDDLAVAALVAGADGVLSKSAPGQRIRDVVRRVAGGEELDRDLRPEVLQRAALRVEPEDLPLLGMLLDRARASDIEAVLALGHAALVQRIDRLIARLGPEG